MDNRTLTFGNCNSADPGPIIEISDVKAWSLVRRLRQPHAYHDKIVVSATETRRNNNLHQLLCDILKAV